MHGTVASVIRVDLAREQCSAAEWLDGKHVVFGTVTKGMDIVKQVEALGNTDGAVSNLAYIENCGEIAPGSDPPPEPQWYALKRPLHQAAVRFYMQKNVFVSMLQGCCNVCPPTQESP